MGNACIFIRIGLGDDALPALQVKHRLLARKADAELKALWFLRNLLSFFLTQFGVEPKPPPPNEAFTP
jgi:hypothetical protein